jgi:hypothetical protein
MVGHFSKALCNEKTESLFNEIAEVRWNKRKLVLISAPSVILYLVYSIFALCHSPMLQDNLVRVLNEQLADVATFADLVSFERSRDSHKRLRLLLVH